MDGTIDVKFADLMNDCSVLSDYYASNGSSPNNVISHLKVYGLLDALQYAGYPMKASIGVCTENNYQLLKRGKKLGNTDMGEGHDNYLVGINVQFTLSCTNKMWVEFERYHFADIISSQSLMHKIGKMEFSFSPYTPKKVIDTFLEVRDEYFANESKENYLALLMSAPSGIIISAGITTNYRQLKTIYHQRKNHRLPEWREFCDYLLTLPYFKELCLGDEE